MQAGDQVLWWGEPAEVLETDTVARRARLRSPLREDSWVLLHALEADAGKDYSALRPAD